MSTIKPFDFNGQQVRTHPVGSEKHLYVVEIVGRGVKVGVSANPAQRFKAHARDAKAYGRETGRTWYSEPHANTTANERALMLLAGPKQKREYLPLDFESTVEAAKDLPKTQLDPIAEAERAESVTNLFKSIVLGGKI